MQPHQQHEYISLVFFSFLLGFKGFVLLYFSVELSSVRDVV